MSYTDPPLQTNVRHKQVGHGSIFFYSEDSSLSVLFFQIRQLYADGALRQDSGKSYTSFDTPYKSRHPQVDHKCLSLTFIGVVGRRIPAWILELSLFVGFNDIGIHEL
jgi:hypothetical protein